MARKHDSTKFFNVSVVGLSGTEKEKGAVGIGKSCLCNRFIRNIADDYNVDHISVLSQSDFSGRVVNNDHFLYWGETTKVTEDGQELNFQVIEQTEFIDDASFQPFKGGKMEPYVKRCSATKLQSAEKLMYICKNQLGIEKEYEQKVLHDGKISIDGFLCLFDVSVVPSRTVEKQVEVVANILNNLVKTKKPIVVVTTKNDDANETFVRELEKLVARKEYKGAIPVVETSAHENINVDLAFIALAQLANDRNKGRVKIVSYNEAARGRRELLELTTDAFQSLIQPCHIGHRRGQCEDDEYELDCQLYSLEYRIIDGDVNLPQNSFQSSDFLPHGCFCVYSNSESFEYIRESLEKTLLSNLKQEDRLPFQGLPIVTDYRALWSTTMKKFSKNDEFVQFNKLFGVDTSQKLFRRHVKKLKDEFLQKRKQGYLEMLPEILQELVPEISTLRDKDWSMVKQHIREHPDFDSYFYKCPEDIPWTEHELEDEDDTRIPANVLDTVEAENVFKNHATALQHELKKLEWKKQFKQLLEDTGYVTPGKHLSEVRVLFMGRECFEALSEDDCKYIYDKHQKELVEKAKLNFQELLLENADLFYHFKSIAPVGTITQEDIKEITNALKEDSRYKALDRLDQDRKVMLFQHLGFVHCPIKEHCPAFPNCMDALIERILANKTHRPSSWNYNSGFLLNADSNQLNLVILGIGGLADEVCNEIRVSLTTGALFLKELIYLQCPFIDVSIEEEPDPSAHVARFNTKLIVNALEQLIQSIKHRAGFINNYQSVIECTEPDIRIIMCMFCGDPYSVENVLGPLLSHQCCFMSGDRSVILETFLGTSKRKVEVIISSFHGANAFREELVHGFILVYSTKRKASLATLNAFSMNIPNLPIQIMAVTDTGGANAFFSSDLSHQLITEGNATADRLQAHFMTSTSSFQQKSAFYTPFFKEVWEKKPEIERAFHMEEPSNSHPRYRIKMGASNGSYGDIYERIPADAMGMKDVYSPSYSHEHLVVSGSDDSESYSPLDNEDVKLGDDFKMKGGLEVYSPPNTPPEPAPPDHIQHNFANASHGSETSSDEITSDMCDSRESLGTHDSGWVDDSVFSSQTTQENGSSWGGVSSNYSQHAFTTGRRRHGSSRVQNTTHTMNQPGKLNMKDYSLVKDAIARVNLGGTKMNKFLYGGGGGGNAPLATPENVDLGSEYAQVKDALTDMYYEGDYMYTPVQDSLASNTKSKIRQRREKGRPTTFSDSDSEYSSLDRERHRSYDSKSRKSATHKRMRKKRSAIPVPTPRVPTFSVPPVSGDYTSVTNEINDRIKKRNGSTSGHPSLLNEDSSLDASSLHEMISSPSYLMQKTREDEKSVRRKEKEKAKAEEKIEKRRIKEEKVKKLAEEREKKKHKSKSAKPGATHTMVSLGDFIQPEHSVPLILEKCIQFIEHEGLDSEGIYRVPGNRAHVDLLFQKFDEDTNTDINTLDIPVNAVATALKDFFSKKLPPLFTEEHMAELEDISIRGDRSCRLLALRALLKKLPPANFEVLKFVFHHLVRVAENCKLNSMDSKNLAICWWPTLLPIEFSDMGKFEQLRPHLEDIVQTMIDQYPFLFCGEEAFVMV
ncbi:rho GTPase-activating protein 190 [Diaphorina citri]|uniref:Rho GTPase-activating protein 190 n=1 Tax=Diaphorina citri TaxID=121845 RepID=A0A1S3DII1_DIACI|nr:rho GTPase-activating protein 190 [Diaphorina citri]